MWSTFLRISLKIPFDLLAVTNNSKSNISETIHVIKIFVIIYLMFGRNLWCGKITLNAFSN